MEKEIMHREEELFNLSSTTRCLSCGQLPRESWQAAGVDRKGVKTPASAGVAGGGSFITDDGSNASPSYVLSDQSAGNPHSQANSEQLYALLTGQAGLRPIQLNHQPMMPRPSTTSGGTGSVLGSAGQSVISGNSASNKRKTNEKIPEPIYRKAKLSAHLKEMVKVSAPAVEQYGYSSVNPLYVLDGTVAEMDQDGLSVTSNAKSMLGSASTPNLGSNGSMKSARAGTSGGRRGVGAQGGGGGGGGGGESLVLPDINNGMGISKPTSPSSNSVNKGNIHVNLGTTGLAEPQLVISQVKLGSHI
jgi:hypothetical protein